MPELPIPSRRTPGTVALAASGLALTVAVTVITMAGVLRPRLPGVVAAVAPYDSHLYSDRALAAAQQGDLSRASDIARDARRALDREPVNVDAFAALGLARSMEERPAESAALFDHAQTLSRRDLLTNIWFTEAKVAQGDVAGALVYYDRALVTSRRAAGILFPILIAATAEPQVARALRPVLRRRPVWWRPFLTQAIATAPSSAAIAGIVAGWLRRDEPNERLLYDQILVRLAGDLRFDAAFALLRSTDPRLAAMPIRNTRFANEPGLPLFDWTLADTEDQSARLEVRDGVPGLAVAIRAGSEGEAARQLVALSPGPYSLAVTSGRDTGEGLSLGLRCADRAATPIGTATPRRGQETARASIVVPTSCPYQWLYVAASGGDTDQEAWVTDIRVKRTGVSRPTA